MGVESAIGGLRSAARALAVVKSDTTEYADVRALYIGTSGDLVVTIGGFDVTFRNCSNGQLLPICPTKIKSATTASDIVALF